MASNTKDAKPLPLNHTLRDLAVLRVSGLDLSTLVPQTSVQSKSDVDRSVERSQQFIHDARTTIKIQDGGSVDAVGHKLEEVRGGIDEVFGGLETPS